MPILATTPLWTPNHCLIHVLMQDQVELDGISGFRCSSGNLNKWRTRPNGVILLHHFSPSCCSRPPFLLLSTQSHHSSPDHSFPPTKMPSIPIGQALLYDAVFQAYPSLHLVGDRIPLPISDKHHQQILDMNVAVQACSASDEEAKRDARELASKVSTALGGFTHSG